MEEKEIRKVISNLSDYPMILFELHKEKNAIEYEQKIDNNKLVNIIKDKECLGSFIENRDTGIVIYNFYKGFNYVYFITIADTYSDNYSTLSIYNINEFSKIIKGSLGY